MQNELESIIYKRIHELEAQQISKNQKRDNELKRMGLFDSSMAGELERLKRDVEFLKATKTTLLTNCGMTSKEVEPRGITDVTTEWYPFKVTLNEAQTEFTVGDGRITAGSHNSASYTTMAYGYAEWPKQYMAISGPSNAWTSYGPAVARIMAGSDGFRSLCFKISVSLVTGLFESDRPMLETFENSTEDAGTWGSHVAVQSYGTARVVIGDYEVAGGVVVSWKQRLKQDIYVPGWYYDDDSRSIRSSGYYCGFGGWRDEIA